MIKRHWPQGVVSVLACCCLGTAGCQQWNRPFEHDGAGGPPTRAIVEDAGQAKHLACVAPSNGTIYVYDDQSNVMIYETYIRKGQTVGVYPEHNKITIDGQTQEPTTLEHDMFPRDHHRIVFLSADQAR